ncbi:MAG TPA: LuxR C-terminal-related transcriptional regulator [Acidimicrobiales bacterium]|nr:LuxR C-terminal-related transcriptional regulator [Acidimicrobiales bacterium]
MSDRDGRWPAGSPAHLGWGNPGDARRYRRATVRPRDLPVHRRGIADRSGSDGVRARRLVEQGLGLGPGGDRRATARRLCGLALVVLGDGDARAATALGEEAAALFRAEGDDHGLVWALVALGLAQYAAGDLAGGDARTRESLAVNQRVGSRPATAHASLHLVYGTARAGDLAAARRHLVRGVEALEAPGSVADEPDWLWAAALVAAGEGRTRLALRLVGVAEAQGRRRVSHLGAPALAALGPWLDGAGRDVGQATAGRLVAEGAAAAPGRLVAELVAGPDGARHDPLSAREQEVVDLVAEGMSNGRIAEVLYISKRTVESHLEHVKQKLGHGTRAEIMAWALRRSLFRA